MMRVIDLFLMTDGWPSPGLRAIGGLAAKAAGYRYDYARGGIVANGCGSDMGHEIVYNLSYALWPAGYGCTGEKCWSNDHSNGDRDYTKHGAFVPHNAVKLPSGLYCEKSQTADHWHRDGGYALRKEWV